MTLPLGIKVINDRLSDNDKLFQTLLEKLVSLINIIDATKKVRTEETVLQFHLVSI